MGFQIALETSSAVGGVALGYDGQLAAERDFTGPLRHAQDLMPTIDALISGAGASKSEIDWIGVSCGPGSYTGIRVGVATAKMLAYALGAKLLLVPTLQVIAQNAEHKRAYVLVDARRKQIYAQLFERDAKALMRPAWPERVVAPEEAMHFLAPPASLMGDALKTYPFLQKPEPDFRIEPEDAWRPLARNVLRLGVEMAKRGEFADVLSAAPRYLRKSEAEEIRERKMRESASLR